LAQPIICGSNRTTTSTISNEWLVFHNSFFHTLNAFVKFENVNICILVN
jgi:hypothetical protein